MLGNSAICALAALAASMSFGIGGVLSLFLEGSLKLAGVTNVKTMQLLNQLCNESQDNKAMNRDACYGCFFRAASHQSGYPLLLSMANCANNYLNNTNYGHCAQYLSNATTAISSSVNPTLVYCSFLECVRQVNKDNLIRECVLEAARLMPGFSGTSVHLAQLFVNTTACVLAKIRCSEPNPITGASRDDSWKDGASFNTLLVNSDYDINIVRLPYGTLTPDECHKYRNVEVASWPTVEC
ncbi:hypothetical protein TSAR_004079 [Trichomalopsis sarcophagae]|uniref:Uncharacterized protein n=1 Tax=Trichomalopsis sarcophagae TaxID=543379 RepID=A0A232EN30_9HYME|nr:hypothetical protein TSAR_004079 [Trichomalopsis sarcophagae]